MHHTHTHVCHIHTPLRERKIKRRSMCKCLKPRYVKLGHDEAVPEMDIVPQDTGSLGMVYKHQ